MRVCTPMHKYPCVGVGMVKKITDKAWKDLRAGLASTIPNSSRGRMSEELTIVCRARQKSYAEIHSAASVIRELA
jgi:hypothetical protein